MDTETKTQGGEPGGGEGVGLLAQLREAAHGWSWRRDTYPALLEMADLAEPYEARLLAAEKRIAEQDAHIARQNAHVAEVEAENDRLEARVKELEAERRLNVLPALKLLKSLQWTHPEPAFPGATEPHMSHNCPMCGAFSGRRAHEDNCALFAEIVRLQEQAK